MQCDASKNAHSKILPVSYKHAAKHQCCPKFNVNNRQFIHTTSPPGQFPVIKQLYKKTTTFNNCLKDKQF